MSVFFEGHASEKKMDEQKEKKKGNKEETGEIG
jgi:hypothetical protein